MSAQPFVRKTNPFDLLPRVSRREPSGQATITNNHRGLQDWDREYVEFGGFFGTHGPDVFAAAPELLVALTALRNECSGTPRPSTLKALLANADLAIAKATGQ